MDKDMKRYAPIALWVGILAGLTAAVTYFLVRDVSLLVQISIALCVLGLAGFIFFDPDRIRRALSGRQARYGSNALLLMVGILGILVVLNWFVKQNDQRWDITENQSNSLTEETLSVLDTLNQPVHAIAFFSNQSPSATQRARDILDQYAANSNGRFSYEFTDPYSDPVAVQNFGITDDQSLVLTSGGQNEIITFLTEKELTGALVRLISGEQRVVYFLTGHGERDPLSTSDLDYSSASDTLESKNYIIESLNLLSADTVPEDADLVVIAAPRTVLSDAEISALDTYLQGGGAMVVMLEPSILSQIPTADDPLAAYLSGSWGIDFSDDIVVDQNLDTYFDAVAVQYADHPITQKLNRIATIYPSARSVQVGIVPEGVVITPLLLTSPFDTSWAETDLNALLNNQQIGPDEADLPGPVTLAVTVESSATGARIVVFGDADYAANGAYDVQKNGDVFINSVDWATEQEELISLTPRTPQARLIIPPFPFYINLVILVSVCVLPGLFLVAGVFVFVQRRKQS